MLKELKSFWLDKHPEKSHRKSPIIWGNYENYISPLCYLRKPKFMTNDDWVEFLDRLVINIVKK